MDFPYYPSFIHNTFGRSPSIYNLRCQDIRKELCRHDIRSEVSRHTCFEEKYYVVRQVNESDCYGESDIADALGIPNSWVCLANHHDMIGTYWIKEDELNNRYENCDGRLVFKKFKLFDDGVLARKEDIINALKKHISCNRVDIKQDDNALLIYDFRWGSSVVADALNIPVDAVMDVSCSHLYCKDDDKELALIILLDKVKELC